MATLTNVKACPAKKMTIVQAIAAASLWEEALKLATL